MRMKQESRILYILGLLMVLVILILGIAGFSTLKKKEQAEEQQITEAEHEVVQIQEPIPYEPIEVKTEAITLREPEYYEELELLARIIHCENSNELDGEEACWNTGSVIINRINSPEYPNTLEGVLNQPGQYDCLKMLYKEEPTDIEWEVAAELLNSGSVLPKEVVYAAELEQGSSTYEKIGNTYYCHK